MSLQSRCNYSAVAARVLWEGDRKGRGGNVHAKRGGRELFMLNSRVRQIDRALHLEG